MRRLDVRILVLATITATVMLIPGRQDRVEDVRGIPTEVYRQEKMAEAMEEAMLTKATRRREVYSFSDESKEMLLKLTMAEAGGEDLEGKCLVMNVVMNRIRDKGFPNTVEGVVFEPWQFEPVSNGAYYDMVPDAQCYIALEMVTAGWDESQGATYFRTDTGESNWHEDSLEKLFVHGGHAFYREV